MKTTKYIAILAILMAALLVGESLVLQRYLPAYSFPLLPLIPAFFFLLGVVAVNLYARIGNVTVLMAVKMAKILLSLAIILAYVFLVKTASISFLVSYLLYFFVYLIYETIVIASINKKKIKLNNEQTI
ncbi:MAG: hypothetical protein LBR81_04070 [Prevotellaceae bacterium]|jgi:hypothetical protein|nr:hypothetical protein [Prevotellaceae bacterium]